MKKVVFISMCAMAMMACTAEVEKPETVGQSAEELFVWGMQNPGYSPVAAGATVEEIATFNPMQIGEEFVFLEEGGTLFAYVSTTNFSFTGPPVGELTKVNVDTQAVIANIPVLDATGMPLFGGFMSGMDVEGSDLIFGVAFLDQSGTFAYGSSIYRYMPSTGMMFEIGGGAGIGVNGVVLHDGFWYGADTLNPNGVIVRGSTQGGPAEVWAQHSSLAPAAGYAPQPYSCDPPAMGVNGIGKSGRLLPCLQSFAVTNVTTQEVLEVPINADGTAGDPTVMYDLDFYPDGLSQGSCGTDRKDTFVADPVNDQVKWVNPYTQEEVPVLPGCDAVTSAKKHDGYLYAVCAASPLSCGNSAPRFVRILLDSSYNNWCGWN